jgi:toxin ParE1/3/4
VTPLRLRASAVNDLREILGYGTQAHGEATAEAYLADLDRAFDRLRTFPELGAERSDLRPLLRCLPCREHRIFYRYDGQGISVVRVLHKAMDAERRLGGK